MHGILLGNGASARRLLLLWFRILVCKKDLTELLRVSQQLRTTRGHTILAKNEGYDVDILLSSQAGWIVQWHSAANLIEHFAYSTIPPPLLKRSARDGWRLRFSAATLQIRLMAENADLSVSFFTTLGLSLIEDAIPNRAPGRRLPLRKEKPTASQYHSYTRCRPEPACPSVRHLACVLSLTRILDISK